MLIGIVLVIFAFNLALPIAQLAQHDRRARTLGIALAMRAAVVPDDDHAPQGDPAGDRLPVDGERPVLRRDQRDLRHADGGRARHRARRAGRHADPRRVLLPDPRAVRQPRPPPPRKAQGRAERGDARCSCSAFPLAGRLVLALVGQRERRARRQRRLQLPRPSSPRARSRRGSSRRGRCWCSATSSSSIRSTSSWSR